MEAFEDVLGVTAVYTRNTLKSDFVSVFAEEEGGDLVQPGISFPGPAEEDLGRVHWQPHWGGARTELGTLRAAPTIGTFPQTHVSMFAFRKGAKKN